MIGIELVTSIFYTFDILFSMFLVWEQKMLQLRIENLWPVILTQLLHMVAERILHDLLCTRDLENDPASLSPLWQTTWQSLSSVKWMK